MGFRINIAIARVLLAIITLVVCHIPVLLALTGLNAKNILFQIASISPPLAEPVDTEFVLVALQSTALVWGNWIITDAALRGTYERDARTIGDGSSDIPRIDEARKAYEKRNRLLDVTRKKTSPLGLVCARCIKPTPKPFEDVCEEYAQRKYRTSFKRLKTPKITEVAKDIIEAASRPNPVVTKFESCLGKLSKGLAAVAILLSVYWVITGDNWKDELGRLLASWCWSFAGQSIGSYIGTLVDPVSRVLLVLVGGIVGTLVAKRQTLGAS